MKSSPDEVIRTVEKGWQVWMPLALDDCVDEPSTALAEEALHIFQPADPPAEAAARNNGSALQAWDPEDITWTPPFKEAEVVDWEGVPAPAKRPSRGQAEASRLTEEALDVLANARTRAEELIFDAQQTRDRLLDQAQAEVEQVRTQAYQEGWTKAQAEAATFLEAVAQMAAEVKAWREQVVSAGEQTVVDMIRQMAAVMFGDGILLDETVLRANLSRIMEEGKSLGNLRVYLNPLDANRLDPAWRETQGLMLGTGFKIITSDEIKPGGCFIDGQSGSVDGRVETQLEAVLGVFDQPDGAPEELE